MNDIAKWLTIYLINSAWQIPVLAASTAVLVKLAARSGAELHYRLWAGCLVLAIALPAIPTLSPMPSLRTHHINTTSATITSIATAPETTTSRIAIYAHKMVEFAREPAVTELLLSLYALSLLLGATNLLRELNATHQVVKRAAPATLPPSISSSLLRSAHALGVSPVDIYTSAGLQCPATVSWPRPMLLVPADFASLPEQDAAAAIGHELAHIRRRDFEANLSFKALSIVAFYHPALHWIERRLVESREVICDDMAAGATLGRTAYAKSLLSLAEIVCLAPASHSLILGVLQTTTLEKRIMKLVDGRLPMTRSNRLISAAACWMVLTALCLGVLSLSVRPSAAETSTIGLSAPSFTPPEIKTPHFNLPAFAPSPVKHLQLAKLTGPNTVVALPPIHQSDQPSQSNVRRIGGDVLAPQVIYQVDPEFSEEARAAKASGIVVVSLTVDEQGKPTNIHVVRGIGLGLDQKAIEAVSQYKFKPATERGNPVEVALNIEVNFQIF